MDAVVVFLLLGLMWAVVLVPPWLQSRRDARPIVSMMTFRSQLWSLRRATPDYGLDSYRYYGDDDYDQDDDDVDSEDAEVHALDPYTGAAVAAAAVGAGVGVVAAPAVAAPAVAGTLSGGPLTSMPLGRRAGLLPASATARRALSYRRRRRILSTLVVLNLAGLAPAIAFGGAYAYAAAAAGGLLVLYLGLLIRRGRREAERARKVRYLTPIRAPRPAVVVIGSGAAR